MAPWHEQFAIIWRIVPFHIHRNSFQATFVDSERYASSRKGLFHQFPKFKLWRKHKAFVFCSFKIQTLNLAMTIWRFFSYSFQAICVDSEGYASTHKVLFQWWEDNLCLQPLLGPHEEIQPINQMEDRIRGLSLHRGQQMALVAERQEKMKSAIVLLAIVMFPMVLNLTQKMDLLVMSWLFLVAVRH